MVQLLEDHRNQADNQINVIQLKEKGRNISININDIYYLESHGNYLKIFLDQKNFLHRQTLQALEARLNPNQFIRIHRSFIVNLNYVKNIKYKGNNQFLFKMKNDQELLSSRGFKAAIEQVLNES